MKIIKRDKAVEDFELSKISNAIRRAFQATGERMPEKEIQKICKKIEVEAAERGGEIEVETIQDLVEQALMAAGYFTVAKAYILYRQKRSEYRQIINKFCLTITDPGIIRLLKDIQASFGDKRYSLDFLYTKYQAFYKEQADTLEILTKAAVELITPEAPDWEFIASRLLLMQVNRAISSQEDKLYIEGFYGKIAYLTNEGLYGRYIMEHYHRAEIEELGRYLDESRNHLLTYSSLQLISKRYLITDNSHTLLERPQEMFMGIAMHLAMPEGENKVFWAKKIYDTLSRLQVTMATPTMSNARKPLSQLSSCFEDVMPDSLTGIYRTIDNFAQVSKFGGGMGIYMGKVRAVGSDIRGFKGVAGGILKWIKLCNDTAIAVDQLGVRQGSVAIYVDIWHRDMPEFLQIRTNNGDDRMKAHDVFPGVCVPDLFWRMVQTDIDGTWYMMCPHEIQSIKGYCLEDYYGEEWERRYQDCLNEHRIAKRPIKVKEMVRLIIKSAVETGTPFIFNRDTVNRLNPNKHQGVIYCSNLCTEIAQNQSEIKERKISVRTEGGREIITTETEAGDFVVCNLASLVLGNIKVDDREELRSVIHTIVRALDNVIDLNFYPIPYAEITNMKMRPIGLGTSGYHHLLAQKGIKWESNEHLEYMDKLYEQINYHAIEASSLLAEEKGQYLRFPGSDWETGAYFQLRGYESPEWKRLASDVARRGMRNAYLLAIAPTSSTSIIAGTTAGIDPVMNRYFLEEKKGSIVPRVAPQLSDDTFWLYKTAHQIDQDWVIDAAGIRQRHIDQSQSVNLFITHDYSFRKLLDLYLRAWEHGVKTLYYVRSRSLEVEECENCSA
ncbi:ribonucleoside-diphosphate reductase subunit alpha [Porphyromonas sp. COT-239 OH1446]|uniref:ribonucleoside-diphosphate reductase subunit alpha n=1 Tax=Porphyromonas sp. COT-239 OH1446 TaxID=1515613 RepID=UPI00052D4D5D|nr:ribonucleoside-diphosphate reductase subunit alpha [Porphyromonas sp. COT-239 OH1446]KGN67174.1 response regulator SirA [Porphyromonas sp. COT-239 OH1446]